MKTNGNMDTTTALTHVIILLRLFV